MLQLSYLQEIKNQFILEISQRNMHLKSYRLPPLPQKRQSLKEMIMQSQKMNIRPKYDSIDLKLSIESGAIELKQPIKMLRRSRSSKRPLSTKSSESKESMNSSSQEQSHQHLKKAYVSPENKFGLSLPKITAKSWVIYEMRTGKYICGKRNYKKRQMASLTKIMTLVTMLQLACLHKINAWKVVVLGCKEASLMGGTSAQLKENGEYSLYDLYHAMMLPSGNDAATQIAIIGGIFLHMLREQGRINFQIIYDPQQMHTYYHTSKANFINTYLAQMNRTAKNIYMNTTHFANPHGLNHIYNLSTADDLAKLCTHAMKNIEFRKIVNTRIYLHKCRIHKIDQAKQSEETIESETNLESETNMNEDEILKKEFFNHKWENTNKMLGEGWSGIKTGITPNAGPCLAASFQKVISGKDYQFLVVLLNSQSMEIRWKEVQDLVRWTIEQGLYC